MLFTLAVMAAVATSTPQYPATSVYADQLSVLNQLEQMFPDVQVDVRWAPCGEENGYYRDGIILLCTEMERYPEAAVGMAAHEFAHAFERQTWGYTTEQEADELATLWLIQLHRPSAMLANAAWLRGLDDGTYYPGDPHPGTAFRQWEITCIVDGALGEGPAECKTLYEGLKLRYEQRLATP